MSKAREESDNLRREAKRIALDMAGICHEASSGTIERLIDCVIFAAVLETAALEEEARKEAKP